MRRDIAYLLLALMIAGALALIWQTRRYLRHENRRRHGNYGKPVRKPFWMP
ncbi:MAG: hypothetical protein ABIT09_11970 [Croceibacterium sp.]